MIGEVVGYICSGGSGPRRVSAPPADDGDPAATKAHPPVGSTGTAAGAVSVQSEVWLAGSVLKLPRALWYSTSSLTSSVFPQSQATANAPARIRADTLVAQRIRASASVIARRTESSARAAGTLSSAARSSLAAALAGSANASARQMLPR